MFRKSLTVTELRELLLRILSLSASLAGFCVAGIALINARAKDTPISTVGDDALAFAALLFLLCTYLAFWALRTTKEARFLMLAKVIDVFFLTGLTLVVASGFGIVYSIF